MIIIHQARFKIYIVIIVVTTKWIIYLYIVLLASTAHVDGHPHVDEDAACPRQDDIAVVSRQLTEYLWLYDHCWISPGVNDKDEIATEQTVELVRRHVAR